MSKAKGSRLERELLHMFWKKKWYCARMAGSGSMPLPCPDLLAGKKGRVLALECKSARGDKRRYINKQQVEELRAFAHGFGAEGWIAVRFNGMAWRFLTPQELGRSKSALYIDPPSVMERGLSFAELLAGKKS